MTQNDTFRHRFSRLTTLSVEQEHAINLLLAGATDTSIATRLKIGRSTLYRWQRSHSGFIAELNRRRLALRAAGIDAARALVPRALETVRDQIVNGNGQLALAVLDKVGIFGTRATGPGLYSDRGPTDPDAVLDEEVRRRRAEGRLPTPTVPSTAAAATPDGTTDGAATQTAPAPEPPITDEERDLVLDELLADLDAEPDPPPTVPALYPPGSTPVKPSSTNGTNGPVVTTSSLSSSG